MADVTGAALTRLSVDERAGNACRVDTVPDRCPGAVPDRGRVLGDPGRDPGADADPDHGVVHPGIAIDPAHHALAGGHRDRVGDTLGPAKRRYARGTLGPRHDPARVRGSRCAGRLGHADRGWLQGADGCRRLRSCRHPRVGRRRVDHGTPGRRHGARRADRGRERPRRVRRRRARRRFRGRGAARRRRLHLGGRSDVASSAGPGQPREPGAGRRRGATRRRLDRGGRPRRAVALLRVRHVVVIRRGHLDPHRLEA